VLRHQVAAGGVALVLGLAAPGAAYGRDSHLELEAGADLHASHYFRTPQLTLGDNAPRPDNGAKIPSVGPLTLGGAAVDVGVALDERVIFPILGFGFNTALGQSPRVMTSIDGSFAEVRPWTAWMYDLGLPGIGFRFKERRWMFSFLIRPGVAFLLMNGSVASGQDSHDVTVSATSLYARAQIEACRRLDPTERVCLFVAPSVYEFGFGTGGSAGIRWEIGP
jgi:hypothetical protein